MRHDVTCHVRVVLVRLCVAITGSETIVKLLYCCFDRMRVCRVSGLLVGGIERFKALHEIADDVDGAFTLADATTDFLADHSTFASMTALPLLTARLADAAT